MAKFGTRCAITFLLGFVLTAAPLRTQENVRRMETGNDLYANLHDCKTADKTETQELNCFLAEGYVMGVWDILLVEGKMSHSESRTLKQVEDTVYRYLAAHPEQRHAQEVVLVIAALTKAYPPQ